MKDLDDILVAAGIGHDELTKYRIKKLLLDIVGDDPKLRLKVEML